MQVDVELEFCRFRDGAGWGARCRYRLEDDTVAVVHVIAAPEQTFFSFLGAVIAAVAPSRTPSGGMNRGKEHRHVATIERITTARDELKELITETEGEFAGSTEVQQSIDLLTTAVDRVTAEQETVAAGGVTDTGGTTPGVDTT